MQVVKITHNLHKISLSLNEFTVNLAVYLGKDQALMVDTGWTITADEVKTKVAELGAGPVNLIILTHNHADHTGGIEALADQTTLIAHKKGLDGIKGKYYALDPIPGPELPIILLENELGLKFDGEEIKIIPAPGHTDNDLVVYFSNAGVVCLGDLVLADTFPPLDLTRGGSAEAYQKSLSMLVKMFPEDVKIITGHGRDYSLDDLKEHYHMVVETMDLIKAGIAAGKSAPEMVEEDLLENWGKWSNDQVSSETWITQVCDNFSGHIEKSISEVLSYIIVEEGIRAAIEQYRMLKREEPDRYNFGENELNMLGYQLIWRDYKEEAIEIFKLNIEAFPESANPYDSIGEAYQLLDQKELAVENYKKALLINPNMESAVEALKQLKIGGVE